MIRVVDALCGAGKSTAIYKKIRNNSDKKYIYITPFLSEIEERIPEELPSLRFKTPTAIDAGGKVADFERLVNKGENIASTHKLFSMLTPEIVDQIVYLDYCLIIDEVTDCIGLLPKDFNDSDTQALLEGEFISIDEENRGKLSWNEDKYPNHDGRYSLIRNFCNLDMLYTYKGKFLMWEACPRLLNGLSEVYILSYLFKGSDMSSWLQINNIQYEYVPHEELGLRPETELKKIVRDNLELLENRNLNKVRQSKGALSKSWFENAKKDTTDPYKAMIRSTIVKHKAKAGDVFWTTFKSHAKSLSGAGYTMGIEDKDKDKEGIAFLPCTIRATNKYRNYWLCVYAMNRFKNPVEVQYMKSNGAIVDEDAYATGELLQFIFRGTLRKGEPMKLLVLSKRMRELLEKWLYEE